MGGNHLPSRLPLLDEQRAETTPTGILRGKYLISDRAQTALRRSFFGSHHSGRPQQAGAQGREQNFFFFFEKFPYQKRPLFFFRFTCDICVSVTQNNVCKMCTGLLVLLCSILIQRGCAQRIHRVQATRNVTDSKVKSQSKKLSRNGNEKAIRNGTKLGDENLQESGTIMLSNIFSSSSDFFP